MRPELEIVTIATPWTGLTMMHRTRSRFADSCPTASTRAVVTALPPIRLMPRSSVTFEGSLNLTANDWPLVEARLAERGRKRRPVPAQESAIQTMISPSARYIDLLIRTLTNTIYEDPSIHPERSGPFQPALRDVGRDWPRTAHTMVGVQRMTHLAELVVQTLADGVPGDFIETGVWRAGCCILMRGVLAAHGVTDRRVYLADSFSGLPPPNSAAFPKDDGFDLSGFTELAVSLEEVRDNFSRYGLLDDQVVFVKGWFSETLMALEAGPFALKVRLDWRPLRSQLTWPSTPFIRGSRQAAL